MSRGQVTDLRDADSWRGRVRAKRTRDRGFRTRRRGHRVGLAGGGFFHDVFWRGERAVLSTSIPTTTSTVASPAVPTAPEPAPSIPAPRHGVHTDRARVRRH